MRTQIKLDRRMLLRSTSLIIPGLLCKGLSSQDIPGEQSESYRDFQSNKVPDRQDYGTKPAQAKEVKKADELLGRVPRPGTPLDVMQYLEHLTETNVEGEAYNGGWRERWNPLIVRFFQQTHTEPAGDTTAWCAASVNWVLAAAEKKGTSSASSGSFRKAGGLTSTPKVGDIVVFQSKDADKASVGHGHVGLFIENRDNAILVLGGNQKNSYGHHAVCRKWIPKNGSSLVFDSFHSVEAF